VLVYFPKEKILDAGSMIKEQLGNVASANLVEYPKTLQKLLNLHLGIRTVISGHWSAVHGPDLITHYLDLLNQHEAAGAQSLGKK
jgi:metallo-beta-lactamase class B